MDYLSIYQRLLSIAQAGLTYGNDSFDIERYTELKEHTLSLIQSLGNEPTEKIDSLFSGETGYQTPKVDVRAFIMKNEKILLVEDTKTKEWSLPGGYADIGFSPKENIIKEVKEETGLSIEVSKLLAIYDTNLRKDIPQIFQYYKLIFACKILSETNQFEKNLETSRMDYFPIDQLPTLSIKRTTVEQLQQLVNLENHLYLE